MSAPTLNATPGIIDTMLVEVEKIAKFPWSPVLAQISTPLGRTAVRRCGDPNACTVPKLIAPGVSCCFATLAQGGGRVLLY
ncbi:hypothetical protein [Dactylosporangium darangshiense]|uniref:Uncharacterized protein n=1 Tax=Dactylosporangium darangshiense TaxID=579108 RepID=A0ABP8DIQ8_9ACTN